MPTENKPSVTVYVILRTDLPLADQIVQACHACVQGADRFCLTPDCRLVVLMVANEQELRRALAECADRGLRATAFYEPDPVDDQAVPMGLTAICTEPLADGQRALMRRFSLWNDN